MPRRNASHQGDSQDVGILMIDERTKAVMTDQPRHAQEAFRDQIARVRDVVPTSNKDDVALVLQYHEGNVEKAIQSFMEDGAKAVLNEWQFEGKKGKSAASKRNKKKRKAQQKGEAGGEEKAPSSSDNAAAAASSTGAPPSTTQSLSNHASSAPPSQRQVPSSSAERSQPRSRDQQGRSHDQQGRSHDSSSSRPKQYEGRGQGHTQGGRRDREGGRPHPHPGRGEGRVGSRQQPSANHSADSSADKGQRSSHPVSHNATGERLKPADVSDREHRHVAPDMPHLQDTIKAKKLGAVLERSTKDLHRTSVALTRHKPLLRERLDQSEKSIHKSFDELHRFLNERQLAITNEFLAVKQEATDMLEAREEQAKEMEKKTHRAATMPEEQILELRAEIKQFVSDRKIDEEIGKTIRYTWNPDPLIELIKTFGEVVPISHQYSTRRPSISSLSSFNTLSRTTSVSEDPSAPLSGPPSARRADPQSGVAGGADGKEGASPSSPTTDMDMKAQVAELAAKLQRTLTQGRKGRGNPKGTATQDGPSTPQNQKRAERSQSAGKASQEQGQDKDQRSGGQRSEGRGANPAASSRPGGRNQNRGDRQRDGHQDKQERPQGARQQGGKAGPGPRQDRPSQDRADQKSRPGQGQGAQQQRRPQGAEGGEQDSQWKENRNAKRRQSKKQRERKQQQEEETTPPSDQTSSAAVKPAVQPETKAKETKSEAKPEVQLTQQQPEAEPASVPESRPVEKREEATPEAKPEAKPEEKRDEPQTEVKPKSAERTDLKGEVVADLKPSTPSLDNDKDSASTMKPAVNAMEKAPSTPSPVNGTDHISQSTVVNDHHDQTAVNNNQSLNGDIIKPVVTKTSNGPLTNGGIEMNGDIPHINGHIDGPAPGGEEKGEAPLPQRETKPRRSQKIEEVVKETSVLNGVVDLETATEREN